MSFKNEKPLIAQANVWKAHSLRSVIEECLEDPRFSGLAKFLINIQFFWCREIPTAAAGYGIIFFNPDFFDSIPEETRKTVIFHEIEHLLFKHLDRSKGFYPPDFNIAADHVINGIAEAEGFTFEGTTPYKDPKYKGQSTEEVYHQIYVAGKEEDKPKPDPNYVPVEKIEELIQDALNANGEGKTVADQKDKSDKDVDEANHGLVGGNNHISLDTIKHNVLLENATYEEVFAKYMLDPLGGMRRTYARINRREHSSPNPTMPGKIERKGNLVRLKHLVYALDVSGSISETQAKQFHQSVWTIKKLLNPKLLTVIFFDTRIVLEKTFTEHEDYGNIKVNAGGGTNLKPVYQRVRKLKPEALVVFTDLCVDIPVEENWDSIWLVPSKVHISPNLYGKVYLIPPLGIVSKK